VAKYCYSAWAWFCYFLQEQSAQLFEQLFAAGYCYVHTKNFTLRVGEQMGGPICHKFKVLIYSKSWLNFENYN